VTDIFMPRQDGMDVLREVKAQSKQPRVVAISGGSPRLQMDFLKVAERMGADAVVHKPFTPSQLPAGRHRRSASLLRVVWNEFPLEAGHSAQNRLRSRGRRRPITKARRRSEVDEVSTCPMCRGAAADDELERVQVWEDAHWRLTVSLASEVAGFAYLEPKRHIAFITELDGPEAETFGPALAISTRVLKDVTGADIVYVYIFGDSVPHLHLHLAPHRAGDALNDQMIKGEIVEEKLPSGMTMVTSKQFPPLPRDQLLDIAARARERFASR
jgi:diadenosine tetraphosphate (Ap4A) HIT family hydrolase